MSSSTALQRQRFNSSSLAMTLHQFDFHLEVRQLDNGSFMAIITGPENVSSTSLLDARRQADKNATGALCYVIAIILIYGLSIIIMIASQIRKNKHDSGVAR
jgi:hypothetical protein